MAKDKDKGKARDAESGQYVTRDYAKKHPATTVVERPNKPRPSNPGKKSK